MMYIRRYSAAVLATGLLLSQGMGNAAPPGKQAHHHEIMPSGKTVPGESIYQLKTTLTDQNGKQTSLAALRGQPVLITMFYTSCEGVCPMLAVTLKSMEAALTPEERRRLRVAMVSFDPERDTPAALRKFAGLHKIDNTRWLLARAPENTVQELAAVLGIRYRAVSAGMYSHSATIVLLDGEGVIRAQTETLNDPDPQFMRTLRTALAARTAS
jgi:protein SCO1/2